MREPLLAHEVVGFEGGLQVVKVDADGAPHEHVLWSLCDLAIDSEKVRSLECLEAKEVVIEVARVIYHLINALKIIADYLVNLFRKEWCWPAHFILEAVKLISDG